jgi:starch phosphorylase
MRALVAEQGLDFDVALTTVRAGSVFTTHTPVPAGIDRFPRELVARHVADIGALPADRVLDLGREADPGTFNMAAMGMRLAQRANGVSILHGEVSRGMFADLWPGFDVEEVPISSVTNGVHAPTWMSSAIAGLVEPIPALSPDDAQRAFAGFARVPDAALWATRRALRARLVEDIRLRLRASLRERGVGEGELGWVSSAFDPDVLTIGFARRVPSYKRLTLMLTDEARLTALLLHPERPIQLVIAGKAHPADDGGKELVQRIVRFADREEVRHRIAFLPDYDIAMARRLYAGCDVWLNNPLRPLEACGTSGMKAALNGCLNLSVRDGWWDEMFDGENGWAIPTADGVDDPARRDEIEGSALYELLEGSVAPRFYAPGPGGVPAGWVAMVRHTLETLGPRVLASRMMRDYVSGLYGPAALSARAMAADGYGGARELTAYRAKVTEAWPRVAVRHAESSHTGDAPELGSELSVRAVVDLGGLVPSEVCVQVVSGRVTSSDELTDVAARELQPSGRIDGYHRYEGSVRLEQPGPFGYTVRVLPVHPLMAAPAEFGLVALA